MDMNYINHITLEVDDTESAANFYYDTLGLDAESSGIKLRQSDTPTSGFRGFALSLIVAQPDDADALVEAAKGAGATILKPPEKSFWGYGAAFQAPDGTVWQVATESKKNTGPATMDVVEIVLLLGVADVKETKQFYVGKGLSVGKAFGGKYVEFETPENTVKLALYGQKGIVKQVGVSGEGSGSHRIAMSSEAGPFTDPDGFAWEAAPAAV